jgi:hypothetical protein
MRGIFTAGLAYMVNVDFSRLKFPMNLIRKTVVCANVITDLSIRSVACVLILMS